MSDWIDFRQVDFSNEHNNAFSIDTRDFHCSARWADKIEVDMHNTAKHPEKYFFNEEELKSLLERYFTESGGVGEWRYFSLEGCGGNWSLKYLRIFRMKRGFIICSSFRYEYTLIKRKLLETPVLQEHLNHH